jgi:hypothetical protein
MGLTGPALAADLVSSCDVIPSVEAAEGAAGPAMPKEIAGLAFPSQASQVMAAPTG